MIVDLSKFIIEPHLWDKYAQKIKKICEDYIYHDGLLRYGLQVTRVTIRMGYAKHIQEDPHLFKTKEEAYAFLDNMLAQKEVATG